MSIKKLVIKNYKSIARATIELNEDINIFVGENDSGKSTILEAVSIVTTGKLNGMAFEKQIKVNLFNQLVREKYINSLSDTDIIEPPQIIIEAYLDIEDKKYSGTNNELREDCPGIRVELAFNDAYTDIYKNMLKDKEIFDIPVEFYTVSYQYFSSEPVVYRFSPIKGVFIDTIRKDYSYIVDKFVANNITTYLNQQERTDLSTAYRKSRHDFQNNVVVKQLNKSISKNVKIDNKEVSIDLHEDTVDEWKNQMSIRVEKIPFENIGFGTQNTIKIELAIKNSSEQVNIVMMEEPENNLSYTNMTKLVKRVIESNGKQVFISTHSSYVANKLDLGKIFLLNTGKIKALNQLSKETKRYFKKLPGYDTLRIVLAEKVVLVEGPTDELIFQRAYIDEHGVVPIANGIDVIVVDALAFKHYCDIAILLDKKVIIITDNDGDIKTNIQNKYTDYLGKENLNFIYEKDENLNTIEPSVLEVNCDNGIPSDVFKEVISKKKSMMSKNKQEILSFMEKNKVEWAMRVFDSEKKINYPEYIKNAIRQCN